METNKPDQHTYTLDTLNPTTAQLPKKVTHARLLKALDLLDLPAPLIQKVTIEPSKIIVTLPDAVVYIEVDR